MVGENSRLKKLDFNVKKHILKATILHLGSGGKSHFKLLEIPVSTVRLVAEMESCHLLRLMILMIESICSSCLASVAVISYCLLTVKINAIIHQPKFTRLQILSEKLIHKSVLESGNKCFCCRESSDYN